MRKTIVWRITLMLILFMGITTMSCAQQITKEQLKELFKANAVDLSSFTSDEFIGQLTARHNHGNKERVRESMERLKTYLSGPFYDDCCDIMYDYYAKHVTESDYTFLLASYKSPEGVAIVEKNSQLMKRFMPALMNYLQANMPAKMQACMDGKKVEPLKYTGPESFKKKWDIMVRESGSDQIVNAVMGNISHQIESVAKKNNPEKMESVKALIRILMEDVFVVVCNTAGEVYTETDLDFSLSLLRSEAGQHLKAANMDMMSNFIPMSQAISEKMMAVINK